MNRCLSARIITLVGTAALTLGALTGCGKTYPIANISTASESIIKDEEIVKPVHFEPISDIEPEIPEDNSDIEIEDASNKVELKEYKDPNGWSVTYNAANLEVFQNDDGVTFVYTGECAGTNIFTITYDKATAANDVVDELVELWGNKNYMRTQGIFPGTENIDGYWAVLSPGKEGSGLYETVIARDYMDGSLVFEVTGHKSGNDIDDTKISDTFAEIIDSISFA